MARKIVITSGKGGVGKTTCCAFIGLNLAMLGARVVMLDVDIGLNNLDVVVGLENRVMYDIVDVVEGKCRVRQALINYPNVPLLYFLPSAHSLNVGRVTKEDLNAIINELSNSFDYILIDCPAGIGAEFYRAIYLASEAIIVTTPSITAIRDANKTLSLIIGCGLVDAKLIVNRVRNDLIAKKLMIKPNEIAESMDIPLLGVVQESDLITTVSSISGELLKVKDASLENFAEIAKTIHFGTKARKESGFFKKFKITRG